MSNIKNISDLLPKNLQERKKETTAPHEIGDCFGILQDLGVVKGKYNQGYWFSLLKKSGVSHYELKNEVIKKMKETESWLKSKGQNLNRGAWLTNRFRERVNK